MWGNALPFHSYWDFPAELKTTRAYFCLSCPSWLYLCYLLLQWFNGSPENQLGLPVRHFYDAHRIWANSGSRWREGNLAAMPVPKLLVRSQRQQGEEQIKTWEREIKAAACEGDGGESNWMYTVCYCKFNPAKYLASESRLEEPASALCNASATAATHTATR